MNGVAKGVVENPAGIPAGAGVFFRRKADLIVVIVHRGELVETGVLDAACEVATLEDAEIGIHGVEEALVPLVAEEFVAREDVVNGPLSARGFESAGGCHATFDGIG